MTCWGFCNYSNLAWCSLLRSVEPNILSDFWYLLGRSGAFYNFFAKADSPPTASECAEFIWWFSLLFSLNSNLPNFNYVVLFSSCSDTSTMTDFSIWSRLVSLLLVGSVLSELFPARISWSFFLNIVFITRFKWKSISCWLAVKSSNLALALINWSRVILRISSSWRMSSSSSSCASW